MVLMPVDLLLKDKCRCFKREGGLDKIPTTGVVPVNVPGALQLGLSYGRNLGQS